MKTELVAVALPLGGAVAPYHSGVQQGSCGFRWKPFFIADGGAPSEREVTTVWSWKRTAHSASSPGGSATASSPTLVVGVVMGENEGPGCRGAIPFGCRGSVPFRGSRDSGACLDTPLLLLGPHFIAVGKPLL